MSSRCCACAHISPSLRSSFNQSIFQTYGHPSRQLELTRAVLLPDSTYAVLDNVTNNLPAPDNEYMNVVKVDPNVGFVGGYNLHYLHGFDFGT